MGGRLLAPMTNIPKCGTLILIRSNVKKFSAYLLNASNGVFTRLGTVTSQVIMVMWLYKERNVA